MAAAVADYRPERISDRKIKKSDSDLSISLVRTKDILASIGKEKREGQLLIGFALETDDGLTNAQSKLERKNLDLIVLNSLQDAGAGFAHDTNRITILGKDNKRQEFELKGKELVAIDILKSITELFT
jgi:phosphopantothenoylcysteine decarboxylase/phosphopantothenate--cysteine ligase